MPDRNDLQLPEELSLMDEESVETYIKALEKGKTTYNNIRIMVVGHFKVGKTTLVKRLFGLFKDLDTTTSTNGIETHVRQCKVDLNDENQEMIWEQLKDGNQIQWRHVLAKSGQSISADDTSVEKIETASVPPSELHVQPDGTENVNRMDAVNLPWSNEEAKDSLPKTEDEPFRKRRKLNKGEFVMELFKNAPKVEEDNKNKINISVWDFAGQYAFYNTHQVFLSRRAVYLIVTDMSKDIRDEVNDTCFEDAKGARKLQVLDFARFWLNSIHEFCPTLNKNEPPVLLVGTFADEYAKKQDIDKANYPENKERLMSDYFKRLRIGLGNGEAKSHISRHFMIDNTCTLDDTCQFEELKRGILEIAKKQSYIGDLIPTKFLLLEETLNKKREEGKKILEKDTDLSKCNEALPFKLDDKEMEVFLRFYHEVGSFIYFSDNNLKDYILLDPQWLIDAFRELITAEEFAPNDDSETFEIWRQFNETAILTQDLIDKCWKDKEMSERTLLLEYMKKLGLIVQDKEKQDSYFAPCMLKQAPSKDLLKLWDNENGPCSFSCHMKSFTSKLCYTTKSKFIPTAIFNRLLAECISRWDIHREWTNQNQECIHIYCGCGVFKLPNAHFLYILFRDNAVQIWIAIHSNHLPSTEICRKVKVDMDTFFENVFKKGEVELQFKCPTGPTWRNEMYTLDQLKNGGSVHCSVHQCELPGSNLTRYWISDDTASVGAAKGDHCSEEHQSLVQPFKKDCDDTMHEQKVDYFNTAMKSVGAISVDGQDRGTVFRVGRSYVMTAWHVIHGIINPHNVDSIHSSDWRKLATQDVCIKFQPTGPSFRLTSRCVYYNEKLDVAVAEVDTTDPNQTDLPKPLTPCKHDIGTLESVSIVGFGHPTDVRKHLDPNCEIVRTPSDRVNSAIEQVCKGDRKNTYRNVLQFNGVNPDLVNDCYADLKDQEKITIDCFMEHGASGSPALANKEVVGVFVCGVPKFYYVLRLKQSPSVKDFPNKYRFEQCTKMEYVYKYMNVTNKDLADELFQ